MAMGNMKQREAEFTEYIIFYWLFVQLQPAHIIPDLHYDRKINMSTVTLSCILKSLNHEKYLGMCVFFPTTDAK